MHARYRLRASSHDGHQAIATEFASSRGVSFVDTALRLLLFAFVKALHDRRSPWYQHGLVGKTLREFGVILPHDVEHRFLGEPAMVLGK